MLTGPTPNSAIGSRYRCCRGAAGQPSRCSREDSVAWGEAAEGSPGSLVSEVCGRRARAAAVTKVQSLGGKDQRKASPWGGDHQELPFSPIPHPPLKPGPLPTGPCPSWLHLPPTPNTLLHLHPIRSLSKLLSGPMGTRPSSKSAPTLAHHGAPGPLPGPGNALPDTPAHSVTLSPLLTFRALRTSSGDSPCHPSHCTEGWVQRRRASRWLELPTVANSILPAGPLRPSEKMLLSTSHSSKASRGGGASTGPITPGKAGGIYFSQEGLTLNDT